MITRKGNPSRESIYKPLPTVSLVISVYNEEKILGAKLENIRSYAYPPGKLQILFGLDGSSDRSEDILRNSTLDSVSIFLYKNRRGKAAVLNDLVAQANGEIIVFSDANTEFDSQAIKELVEHFDDPTVGAVSGHLQLLAPNDNSGKTGEYTYWAFENLIKSLESISGSLLGATGGIYAIRKLLFTPLPLDISIADDFFIPIEILKKGYRTVFAQNALAFEYFENSVRGEFRRKVRIGAQNFNILSRIAPLLTPQYGFLAFSLWSHKIIRWFIPFLLLLTIIISSILINQSSIFKITIVAWIGISIVSLLGFIADTFKIKIGCLKYPYYFLAMNYALFFGSLKAILKKQKPIWNVSR